MFIKEGDDIENIKKIFNKQNIFFIIFALVPFIYGVSLDFSVFLVTTIFLIEMLIIYCKNKKLKIKINHAILCSIILLIFAIFSAFWGIDKIDSKIGILRYLSLVVFNILIMQFSEDKKEKLMQVIAYSSLMMLFISLAIGLIPNIRNIVYSTSGRLTGFFEYANTFALYPLIGMIIFNEKNNFKYGVFVNIIFLIGIILTGSRTTFILMLIYLIFRITTKKIEHRKINIISYSIFLIIIVLGIIVIKNNGISERIFSISINSGTFLERIVYWKDGIKLLKSNLFGYGYMGYFYKVFEVQTGMYVTKFVHNEYLQMALDIGMISAIIFAIFLIKMLVSKENLTRNKIILVLIMLHMFMDFDLQFMIIFYIVFLCFDNKIYKEYQFDINITFIVAVVICMVLYGYWFLATFMNHIQNTEIASNLLKDYTEPKITILSKEDDINKAYSLASEIEENNKYVQLVYNIKSMYYLQKGNMSEMVKNKKRQIELSKYDKNVYEEYVLMISKMLEKYVKKEDDTNLTKCINYIIEIEDIVKNANSNMDSLEYKIKENPEINLSDEVKNYIEEMKKIKMEGSN